MQHLSLKAQRSSTARSKRFNYLITKESISYCFFIRSICKFAQSIAFFKYYFDERSNVSTFVCPTEIIAFSDRINEFKELNTEVVGVSTDSQFSHLAWINLDRKQGGLGGLTYPLLSDFNKTISKDYDVLVEKDGLALRGLFLIDPNGIVCQITINDLPVGRSIDETLRLIKAFQFVEKHGEVCPANWDPKKKADTIKPDPKGSLEYFQKH